MPRRNRIILEQRERIIQAFENTNEDYLMVADTIGVNRSTARSIVARYVREGRIAERPRGGPNNVRGQGGKTADWLFISRVLALSADQSKAAQVN